jgi:nucleoside-diphosphate-sugar epimerase
MRVLLTGADGYLGSLAAPVLAEAGHEVVGLDTGFYRSGWLYDPLVDRVAVLHRDVREITAEDLEGCEAIVHMAELSNDPLGQFDPTITHEINHRASVRLATLAKSVGVERFVYTSSCSVYGIAEGEVAETSATDPQTAYAECKVLVERDVALLADDQFHPTFLRNATAFGASPRLRLDVVLNNLCATAKVHREIRMLSDGTPWRPLVHGLDIAQAVACALHAPIDAIHGEIFNVGSSAQNYQVRDIAEIVADAFDGCELSFGPPNADNRSYRVNFDKITEQLPGFSCQWNAALGAAQLRSIFDRVEFGAEDLDGRRYVRLAQLEYLVRTGQLDRQLMWNPIAARPSDCNAV